MRGNWVGRPAPAGPWQAAQAGTPLEAMPAREICWPRLMVSLLLAASGWRVWLAKYWARPSMSASERAEAMPVMMALARSGPLAPPLKLCNCLRRYSGCWPASFGLVGIWLLPSAPWQPAHTCSAVCLALARSAGAGFASLSWAWMLPATSSSESNRERLIIMSSEANEVGRSNPVILSYLYRLVEADCALQDA